MERHPDVDPMAIGDVLMGCANQAGEDNRNVARMASLLAGLPQEVPAETINRLCASGLAASVHASRMLHMGDAQVVLAGGVEHMTRGPWVLSKASKPFGRDMELHDTSFGWRFINPRLDALYGTEGMGQTAENLVDLHNLSREDQDAFAYRSQMKAAAAQKRAPCRGTRQREHSQAEKRPHFFLRPTNSSSRPPRLRSWPSCVLPFERREEVSRLETQVASMTARQRCCWRTKKG